MCAMVCRPPAIVPAVEHAVASGDWRYATSLLIGGLAVGSLLAHDNSPYASSSIRCRLICPDRMRRYSDGLAVPRRTVRSCGGHRTREPPRGAGGGCGHRRLAAVGRGCANRGRRSRAGAARATQIADHALELLSQSPLAAASDRNSAVSHRAGCPGNRIAGGRGR